MSDISILDIIDEEEGKRPWTSEKDLDKIRQEISIISGEKPFHENIDTYPILKRVLDKAAAGEFPKGYFKFDIVVLAKEVKKIVAKMDKEKVEEIINAHDEKGMTRDEKAVFDFASQIEDVIFRKTIANKYMSPTDSGTSVEMVSKRAYNMIPVKMRNGSDTIYGYITAPQGIITWQKNIEKFKLLGDIDSAMAPELTATQKERLEKVNKRKDLTAKEKRDLIAVIRGPKPVKKSWDEMSPDEQKNMSVAVKAKVGGYGDLPYKLPLFQDDDGAYKVEMNKQTREIIDKYNLMFNDSEAAKKKLLDKVTVILKSSKKYGKLNKDEMAKLFKYHGVKTFATENLTFWKTVESLV
jgi:hypothetical protein